MTSSSPPAQQPGLSDDKTSPFWAKDVTTIGRPARELLEQYSKIPAERFIPHVLEIGSTSPSFLSASNFLWPPNVKSPPYPELAFLSYPNAQIGICNQLLSMYAYLPDVVIHRPHSTVHPHPIGFPSPPHHTKIFLSRSSLGPHTLPFQSREK